MRAAPFLLALALAAAAGCSPLPEQRAVREPNGCDGTE